MKLLNQSTSKKIAFIIMSSFYAALAFAQDSSTTTTHKETSTTYTKPGETITQTNDWYNQPWVWVVGGVLLILILILLFSQNKNKTVSNDRVTVTKTVKTERDTD